MDKRLLATCTAAFIVAMAGCDQKNNSTGNRSNTGAPNSSSTDRNDRTDKTPPKADNTDRNKQDRDGQTKTPIDQGQNSTDVRITADIRKAILDNKNLSVNAQNCKVITENGVVTLRGPVDSQAEKDAIESAAKSVAGVSRVQNELEVKNK